MPGLPSTVAIGTITDEIQLRFTQTGLAVCSFSVACNERKRDAQGNWSDGDTTFLRCNLWRKPAELAAESLSKGDRVVVVGQLKQRSYEHRDGGNRTTFELEVEELAASVKFATVKVQKAARSGDNERERIDERTGLRHDNRDDPWETNPPF